MPTSQPKTEAAELIERIRAYEPCCLVEARTTDLPIAELIEKLEQGNLTAMLNHTPYLH